MKKLVLLVALLTVVAFASSVMAQAPAKPAGTAAPAAATVKPADKPAAAAPAATGKPAKAEKAADKPKAAKAETFKGAVVKVDEAAKAVVVKGKDEKTFAVDEKTKITKGKDTLALADLKAEMAVTVSYKKDGDKMVASAIKADAPKASKADKAEKKAEKKADKPAEAPKK